MWKLILLLSVISHSLTYGDDSYFVARPENPQPGDHVTLECVLIAPDGFYFQEIYPELKSPEGSQFYFEDVQSKYGNSYNGLAVKDERKKRLLGRISILNVTEMDYFNTFTCIQYLDTVASSGTMPLTPIERNLTLSKIKVPSTNVPTVIPTTYITNATTYPVSRTTMAPSTSLLPTPVPPVPSSFISPTGCPSFNITTHILPEANGNPSYSVITLLANISSILTFFLNLFLVSLIFFVFYLIYIRNWQPITEIMQILNDYLLALVVRVRGNPLPLP